METRKITKQEVFDGASDLLAHCLLRVLIETVVTMLFMHKENPEERARRYVAHHFIQFEKMVKAVSSRGPTGNWSEDVEKSIASIMDDFRKEFGDASFEEMRAKMWKGMMVGTKIEDAFNAVGLKIAYDTVYRAASFNVHADDAFDYIEKSGESYTLLESNPEKAEKYLAIGAALTCRAMDIAGRAFSLDSAEDIAKREIFFTQFNDAIPD